MKHALRLVSRAACASVSLAWAGTALAAWEIVPAVLVEAEANDNPRLLPESSEITVPSTDPASRLLAEARLLISSYSTRGELSVEPALRTDAYAETENEDLQSTDVFLRSRGRYRWERARTGFDADFSREKILGTEFLTSQPLDPEIDDLIVTDTVLLAQNERRNRFLVAPFVEFDSSTSGVVRLDSRFLDVRYDGSALTQRTDFRSLAVGVEYIHRLDSRSTISGRLDADRFEADANQNTTDTAGVEVRFARDLSETWSLDLALGGVTSELNYVDLTATPVSVVSTDENFTFSVGLRKRAELSRLSFDLQRRVSPDSFGFLVARNQLRFALTQRLSPTLQGLISVRAIQTESIHEALREDRRYGRLGLGLNWAFAELWSLTADYSYSSRDVVASAFDTGDASANSVSIGLSYRGREQPR